mgnify:CR=1 FL=1
MKLFKQIKRFKFSDQVIANKNLANMTKKENFKFNFKKFFDNFHLNETNCKNRKVEIDLDKLMRLYDSYLDKENNLILMRSKYNEMKLK